MQFRFILAIVFLSVLALMTVGAPPIELELATERGLQITAPQEWLQLLAGIGIHQVDIRGSHSGDEPHIESRGGARAAGFHVVGILTSGNQLRLPGGTFSRSDRTQIKDYFARLSADGADAATSPRIRFGLTEKELTAVLADLAQPIDFETKGLSPRSAIDRLHTKCSFKFAIDADAQKLLRTASPIVDDFKGVAAGTGSAIILRNAGMLFRPEKNRGEPTVYRVVVARGSAISQKTLGKMSAKDMQYWPIGWEPGKSPGEVAPSLFESLNAEIDGYSLSEALAAIGPRLKLPMLLDRAALKANRIEPTKLQVRLARTRTSYKRVIDRILSQARLGSEVRVDEAGVPFLWITR
jgi:hypothetical protein